jgi:hypothetical protein
MLFKKNQPQASVMATPVFPALRRLRQEDREFEASLGNIGSPCLKETNKKMNLRLYTV